MAQYKSTNSLGITVRTINVENGSQDIFGVSTLFLSNASVGDRIVVGSDAVSYEIGAVNSNAGVAAIELTAPYAGIDGVDLDFVVWRDTTINIGLYKLNARDLATAPLFNYDMDLIDAALAALPGPYQPLDAALTALSGLNSTPGILVQTGADAFTKRTLQAPAAGFTITNPAGTAGDPTFVLANDLAALEALASTGFAVRTGASTWVQRSLQYPSAGLTITNTDGVSGNPAFDLANDLAALEALISTGIAVRTGTDAWAQRTLQAPAAGLGITNPAGIAGDPTFALANDLAALEGLSATGFAARSAADTWVQRSIAADGTSIDVSNGDGVSGNPTLSHHDTSSQASVDNSGSTFLQDITLDTYGHVTALASVSAATALGSVFQPLDATLTALAALDAAAGFLTETAADTFVRRSFTDTSEITWTNPAGTAGNPSAALINASIANARLTNSSITIGGASTALGGTVTATTIFDSIGSTRGSVLYRGASGWAILSPGTAGLALTSGGAGADPVYATLANAALTNSSITIGGNVTALGASVSANNILASIGTTRGSILYRGVASWVILTPGATGLPLLSQGAGADPTYTAISLAGAAVTGTLPLGGGGTGQVTAAAAFNALSPLTTAGDLLYGGASGAGTRLASVAAGSYLRSGGVATAPVWSTPTLPNSATSGKVLIGDGTNIVLSTPTFPNASAAAGKVIRSDGTNWLASSFTFPDTAVTGDIPYASATSVFSMLADVAVGSYLRSGGVTTAPVWSTVTLPNAITANRMFYGSASNAMSQTTNLTWDETNLTIVGNAILGVHLKVQGTIPSIAAGIGAGTSPTVAIDTNATDTAGKISITTGTSPTGVGSVIVTVTFATAFTNAPYVYIFPLNRKAIAQQAVPGDEVIIGTITASTFTLAAGTNGLTASTLHTYHFLCVEPIA